MTITITTPFHFHVHPHSVNLALEPSGRCAPCHTTRPYPSPPRLTPNPLIPHSITSFLETSFSRSKTAFFCLKRSNSCSKTASLTLTPAILTLSAARSFCGRSVLAFASMRAVSMAATAWVPCFAMSAARVVVSMVVAERVLVLMSMVGAKGRCGRFLGGCD